MIVGICFVALLLLVVYSLSGEGMQFGRFSSKEGVMEFDLSRSDNSAPEKQESAAEPRNGKTDDPGTREDIEDGTKAGHNDTDGDANGDTDGNADGDIQLENQEPGTGVPDRLYFSDQVVSQWRENGQQYEGTNLAEIFEFLKLDIGVNNGERCLDGALRNKSKLDFKPIRLVFEFFDDNSVSLGTEILENKGFYAFNTWIFQVPIRSEQAVQFGVRVLELNGKSTKAEKNE